MMLTVFFETFGCQMNVADSDSLCGLLERHGYAATQEPAHADLVVVNTCSVREHAERRAKARIREYLDLRRKEGRNQAIWVVGCMAQRLGDGLKRELPGVDRVIGARDIDTIHERIVSYLDKKSAQAGGRPGPAPISAFVAVMRGCDNHCSYCVVPSVRGPERSIAAGRIVDEVKALVQRGTREVTLLGQNVNSYHDEVSGCDFPGLLERVQEVAGLERVRFTTSHPKDCSPRLIRAVAELPAICKHFHLPVQSGSTRILGLMNRIYTREDYLRLIERIRDALPGADITTDVMVGFPSETAADFADTLSLIEQVRFTSAFMFAYSPRPGTAAASMTEGVDAAESRTRLAELIEAQTRITKARYCSMVGSEVRALLSGRQQGRGREWMGRDMGCKRVLLACDGELAGMILPLRVKATSGMTLLCERILS